MYPRARAHALLLACACTSLGCSEQLNASPEPMGAPAELGGACEQTPVATGIVFGEIAPNFVATDQYGEQIELYADLCDRHVVIARAGFD